MSVTLLKQFISPSYYICNRIFIFSKAFEASSKHIKQGDHRYKYKMNLATNLVTLKGLLIKGKPILCNIEVIPSNLQMNMNDLTLVMTLSKTLPLKLLTMLSSIVACHQISTN